MALKAVFFDAAGTLFKTVRPVGESYARFAQKYGMDVAPADLSARFHVRFSDAPPLAFPGAPPDQIPQLERDWWKNLVREIFQPWGPFRDFEEYFSDLFAYFKRADSWSLYADTVETLSTLKGRGFILVVVSNFDSRVLGIIEGLGIAPWFDSVIISSQVGYAKPAPEIFHSALSLHELDADEALHIGDSLDKDVAGARNAGLTGVWLNRRGFSAAGSSTEVRSLNELVAIADRLS
ncbi:MAG: HAD-IA family hydrolase [Deltaproteobacteria bacterium]|nr:HAD-IA family hydrolase [Deltaproteobacteria bacterium]